jgi:hypothetical protein
VTPDDRWRRGFRYNLVMNAKITPDGRIEGTRITVYDVLDYADHHHTYIAALLQISSHEVFAAQEFIEQHRAEVMKNYQEMLERDRRGNPPHIRAMARKSRAKFKAMLKDLKKKNGSPSKDRKRARNRG